MELNEDFIIGHEEPFARALVDKLGLARALGYANGVVALIRADAEREHSDLGAALGQPEATARRERRATTTPAPPATQTEVTERVGKELLAADGAALTPRSIAMRTRTTVEQVDVALKEIRGVVKHGRKYALKAGS